MIYTWIICLQFDRNTFYLIVFSYPLYNHIDDCVPFSCCYMPSISKHLVSGFMFPRRKSIFARMHSTTNSIKHEMVGHVKRVNRFLFSSEKEKKRSISAKLVVIDKSYHMVLAWWSMPKFKHFGGQLNACIIISKWMDASLYREAKKNKNGKSQTSKFPLSFMSECAPFRIKVPAKVCIESKKWRVFCICALRILSLLDLVQCASLGIFFLSPSPCALVCY